MRRLAVSILLLLINGVLWAAPAPIADPAAEYAARAEKLGEKDAKGWLKLADFCEDHLLWDKRTEALHKAVAGAPDNAEAHGRLDEVKLGKDWIAADEAEAKEGAEKQAKGLVFYGKGWVAAKDAEKLRQGDAKAVGWDVQVRMDTPHLALYSSKSLDFTRRIAAVLENEITVYERYYSQTWKLGNPKPFKVYAFGDWATYDRIGAPVASYSHLPGYMTGFYAHTTGILYVGLMQNAPEGNDMLITTVAAHEMLHGIDDLLAHCVNDGTPQWIKEGRAEHFGRAVVGRQILPGAIVLQANDNRAARVVEAMASTTLAQMLDMDRASFSGAEVRQHYALAMAFVHFLFHGDGGKHAAAFKAFLAGMPAKTSRADFEKAVGKLADLELAFKKHVDEVFLPAAKVSQGQEKPEKPEQAEGSGQ